MDKMRQDKSKNKRFGVLILGVMIISALLIGCGSVESVVDESPVVSEETSTQEIKETVEVSSESSTETLIETIEETSEEATEIVESTESEEQLQVTPETIFEVVPEEIPETIPEVVPEEIPESIPENIVEIEEDLTTPQRNSINMLNYITVLTQEINNSKNSRIYLDSVQSSLLNNMNLNAIDTRTQSEINNLWRTINGYKMIDVKRERLDYIYEQNKAQALRSAIPNPVGLLSVAQPGGLLKTAASVLYMAVDSKASYNAAIMAADLKHLEDNWELEDAEAKELSDSQLNLLNYMTEMARDNGIPTECTLNDDSVADFVEWSSKDNLVSKISWLESHEDVYKEFRTYWLELAESYYNSGTKNDYRKCLSALEQYEEVATKIFRKDYDYAETLPMAIIAAKETMTEKDYCEYADKYVAEIVENCDDENWALRYFASQIYIDLYACTEDKAYLDKAYNIAFENVNLLVYEQIDLNKEYLAPVVEEDSKDGYTKRQNEEVKEYNKLINEKRKVELPPVSEAFYLNCDLLFALADERSVSISEKKKIDAIIHEDGKNIFLTDALDDMYWANNKVDTIDSNDIDIEFNGEKLVIPVTCVTDRSEIKVTISGGIVLEDWVVKEVKRPKNSIDPSEFMVTLTSKNGKDYKYAEGEIITISVVPVKTEEGQKTECIDFKYEVNGKKTLGVIEGIEFERVK